VSSQNQAPDEADDLFNFDDLFRGSSQPESVGAGASTSAPLSAPRPTPTSPAPSSAAAPGQLPLVKAVAPKPAAPAPAPSANPAALPRRFGAPTVALLLIATLANLALVGVVWRSMSGMGSALSAAVDKVANANESPPATAPRAVEAWEYLNIKVPTSNESKQALDAAAKDLSQGDFERARARLYSLLAVVDRFDVSLRAGVTSRAQVMLADSFREQADRIEAQGAARPAQSGFLTPSEGTQR
jgi:hypothetical protein